MSKDFRLFNETEEEYFSEWIERLSVTSKFWFMRSQFVTHSERGLLMAVAIVVWRSTETSYLQQFIYIWVKTVSAVTGTVTVAATHFTFHNTVQRWIPRFCWKIYTLKLFFLPIINIYLKKYVQHSRNSISETLCTL